MLRDRDTDANGTLDERLWVQQDANWNVTALVNGSGTVVERFAYDPYGVQSVYNASWSSIGSSAYSMNYGFQGERYDAVSGLDAAHERWYSPTLARWGSVDPIRFGGGDRDLYGFVGNNPTNRTDPSGLHYLSSFSPIIEIVSKAKAESDNGKATFQVKWVIPKDYQNSTGWIIQHVTKTFDVRDKDGKKIDVYHDYIGQLDVSDADFYEAWEFTPGGKVWIGPAKDNSPHQSDTFAQGIDFGKCTKGKIEVIAEVKAFPNYRLPNTFKVKMDPLALIPLPVAGALPVSKTMPSGWNRSLPGAKHTLTIEWDTTDPDPKKWKKTTVTSTP